jgi:predicted short-subunit dehydrogenase-like oxidoreductase (DUF2520 family)
LNLSSSRIAIAGTGNIAQSLGRLLLQGGVEVVQLVGRNLHSARRAAAFIGEGVAAGTFSDLTPRAERLIIAVADSALAQVVLDITRGEFSKGIVLHTSGGSGLDPMEPLRQRGIDVGVIHPLQSVPSPQRGVECLPGSFFAVAGDAAAVSWAESLAASLYGRVLHIGISHWALYHAAAVIASNYQVTLLDAALELLGNTGIPPGTALEALAPIVRATTENALSRGTVGSLTGPIQRGDLETVSRHLGALAGATPETRHLYTSLGLRTVPLAVSGGLSRDKAVSIQAALRASQAEITK